MIARNKVMESAAIGPFPGQDDDYLGSVHSHKPKSSSCGAHATSLTACAEMIARNKVMESVAIGSFPDHDDHHLGFKSLKQKNHRHREALTQLRQRYAPK
jgi:hypothetical protein